MKKILYIIFAFGYLGLAQETDTEKADQKALQASKNLTWEGNKDIAENNFVNAEVNYRRAISKSSENSAASYNLGNAYYNEETYSEAYGRFKQAGELASSKSEKHGAYHNMGNVFMKSKEYEKAVEAYKEALRNNPADEETRYNLALAKELLKKQQDEEKKNDKNEDNKDQEDKKEDNKDEGDKDKNDEGDQKEDENKDKGNEGDKGDEKPEENKKGDGDKKEEEKPQEQKQPRPNQLSPQQIQNLLEAMQNEEKKVQEKINAKKMKGVKMKNEKDW